MCKEHSDANERAAIKEFSDTVRAASAVASIAYNSCETHSELLALHIYCLAKQTVSHMVRHDQNITSDRAATQLETLIDGISHAFTQEVNNAHRIVAELKAGK